MKNASTPRPVDCRQAAPVRCRRRPASLMPPILVAVLTMAGCLGQPHPQLKTHYYMLSYDPPALDEPAAAPAVVRVNRFSVAPLYRTRKIVFVDHSHHGDYYNYHRWRVNPADLIGHLLVRDLQASRRFQAVFGPGKGYGATHILDGSLVEFYELKTGPARQAVMAVTVTLMRTADADPARSILFQKTYTARQDCDTGEPAAFAAAMSRAMAGLSRQILQDVSQAVDPSAASPPKNGPVQRPSTLSLEKEDPAGPADFND